MPLAGAAYVGLGKVWREWNDLAQAAAHLARRIEHVAAPLRSPSRRLQDWLEPLWRILGDGCHPNRETWVALEQAGFEQVDYEHFQLALPITGPHIAGSAQKG